jgi:hypothetical protein
MFQGLQYGLGAFPPLTPQSGSGLALAPPGIATAGDEKKKKPVPYDMGAELRKYGNTPLKYDNGDTATNIAKLAGAQLGIKPSILLSSGWQEGMNKAALDPESVSEYYNKAGIGDDFPVDGFLNYGVDTIGDKWDKVKKYLPEGFEKNMKFYEATNEKDQKVKTAAFKSNQSALMAKAAMMKLERDNVMAYAKKKGLELDENTADYFMLAGYNGGEGNAREMLDEYMADTDKANYVSAGRSKKSQIHKNIKVRMDNMKIADELLSPQPQL